MFSIKGTKTTTVADLNIIVMLFGPYCTSLQLHNGEQELTLLA